MLLASLKGFFSPQVLHPTPQFLFNNWDVTASKLNNDYNSKESEFWQIKGML
jgi:hypothetical protein